MLSSSFKTQVDIISWPPKLFFAPTLQNYQKVFEEQDFLKYFFNSTIVGVVSVGLSLVLGLPAAYSIARYTQKKLSVFILLARLMPGISFLVPWYIVFSRLNLMDSYIALILSHMLIALPIVVWIMTTYFNTIPCEMEESAMVDGATRQYAFFAIILPLSGPGIITATTLSFIFSWNNFMFSQVLSMEKTKTLPIAVYNFVSYAEVDWGGVMAAAVAIMTPAIILTMIFQKYVVKGLRQTGPEEIKTAPGQPGKMTMMLDSQLFDKFGVEYSPGDIIFCEFEPGNEFYFIQAGRIKIVKIINNTEKTLDILEVGDVFGEMAILEEQPRSASAIAIDHVKLLKFRRENFDALLQGNPQLAYKLLIIFSKRIYDQKRRLMILLLEEPQVKVMDVLNMLAEQDPHLDLQEAVTLKVTMQEVANWAGMQIDEVQKILAHLNQLGKIELFADKIVVKNIRDFLRIVSSRRKSMYS